MAITKNIVELMGGTIDVSSIVNQGSIFRVELEFRVPEEQMDKQFWKNSGISHMLLVDSNVQNGNNVQELMQEMGVVVDTVQSAEAALGLIQDAGVGENAYQVILLDWDSLNRDLSQTVERIKKILPNVLLLLLQGYEEEDTEESSIQEIEVMQKPFFVSALKEKVIKLQNGGKEEDGNRDVESGNLEGMHFLAAEDNEINAEILREILAIENASCEIVENGQQAVERFAESKAGEFDAILMDVQMPVMNGYEATKAIRALDREDAVTIPIIAMTANAFAEDEKEALQAGMNVHLAKPINVTLLKQIIKQYVTNKETRK